MIAALALALLAQEPIRGELSVEPSSVEVGEPFELTLLVTHDAGSDPTPAMLGELDLDPSWVVLETGGIRRDESGENTERTTRRTWTVVSLEPGARVLVFATDADADGSTPALEARDATIEIRGVLAAGEDLPRPLRGFPEGFTDGESEAADEHRALLVGLALGLGAVLVALGIFTWLRLSRRRTKSVVPPTPLERLAVLGTGLPEDVDEVKARHFALTRLLREATEAQLGDGRQRALGLSDDEWLERMEHASGLDSSAREALAEAFEGCSAVKYAGAKPTAWAFEETVKKARNALFAVNAAVAARPDGGEAS